MQKFSLAISKQTLTKMGICAGVILAFGALIIVPGVMESKKVGKATVLLQVDIEKQRVLFPIYLKLKGLLERKLLNQLPVPEPKALEESELNAVIKSLEQAAIDAGLKPLKVFPDPASLAKETGMLGVDCEFFGKYLDFQKFYFKVGELPSLRHFEKVEAKEGPDGVNFTLRLQLAVKTG